MDDAGAVYVTTQFRQDIDIDGTLVDPEGSGGNNFHALLVKFDALGAYQWHWNSTHEGDDRGNAITITDDGNILFAVRYNEELTVNDVHYENEGGGIALIEVEPDGTYVWDHQVYTEDTNQADFWSMQFDYDGNLYIAGASRTTLSWDEDTEFEPSNPMRTDAFVIKLNGDRSLAWSKFFGDEDENALAKAVSFVDDMIYVGGEFIGTMELDDDITLSSNDGSRDVFYALMDPADGSFYTGGAFGGDGNEFFSTMDVNQHGETYFIGRFLGTFEAGGESYPTEGSFDFFVTRYVTMDEEPEPELYTVTFDVTDEEGNPIADAIVTFDGETNAAGDYVFDDIEEGSYVYAVEKEGFYPADGTVEVTEDVTVQVELVEAETMMDLLFNQPYDYESNANSTLDTEIGLDFQVIDNFFRD